MRSVRLCISQKGERVDNDFEMDPSRHPHPGQPCGENFLDANLTRCPHKESDAMFTTQLREWSRCRTEDFYTFNLWRFSADFFRSIFYQRVITSTDDE